MNTLLKKLIILSLILVIHSCNSHGDSDTIVTMKTTLGEIKIKLYNDTPLHKQNFLKLINSSFYENVSFHRIIKDFMIQAGDPSTKSGNDKQVSDSLKSYTIPAEVTSLHFHKKGALAAARTGIEENPEMRSSGTQFYIVQGIKYTDAELDQAELRINSNIKQALFNKLIKQTSDSLRVSGKSSTDAEIQELASVKMFDYLTNNKPYKIPEDQRNIYKTIGGVPRLDCTYTVFGEVTEGLDIVDRIASVPTDSKDKPLNEIRIIKIKVDRN
jgi:cyclophilin family peptidyl-prolyl cis-trans isomerase